MTRSAVIVVFVLSAVAMPSGHANAQGCSSCSQGSRTHGFYGHPHYVGQPYAYRGYVPRTYAPIMASPYPASPLPFPVHMVPRVGEVGAPRGTLGWTYKYPTRHMSRKLHPRMAALEVNHVPLGMKVMVVDEGGDKVMSGHADPDGVWRFSSTKPMMPGLRHVYYVVIHDETRRFIKQVRLVPDKITSLDL
ncbi:MAG: hypothetical protein O3A00_21395 [Planctomycetota bacterium]|nr:hypothetical protein [Planctomycetota bacterium]